MCRTFVKITSYVTKLSSLKIIIIIIIINSYEFKFLFTSCAFPIGQSVLKRNLIGSSKSNRKLINFLSNELINLRKGIGAIFYQHFHCIDSNWHTMQTFDRKNYANKTELRESYT